MLSAHIHVGPEGPPTSAWLEQVLKNPMPNQLKVELISNLFTENFMNSTEKPIIEGYEMISWNLQFICTYIYSRNLQFISSYVYSRKIQFNCSLHLFAESTIHSLNLQFICSLCLFMKLIGSYIFYSLNLQFICSYIYSLNLC